MSHIPTIAEVVADLRTLVVSATPFIVVGDAAATIHGSPYPVRAVEVVAPTLGTPEQPTDLIGTLIIEIDDKRYTQLSLNAIEVDIGDGLIVRVAALRDVIREILAHSSPTPSVALPTLYRLLELAETNIAVTTTKSDNKKTTSPT